jgi:dTDP-4-dehydrorhamnose reductase
VRLLLTGAAGLLGGRLAVLLARGHDVIALRHRSPLPPGLESVALDLLGGAPDAVLDAARPEAVVHAAALVEPDRCEREPELARRLNVVASERLARACASRGVPLVLVSTDLVFSDADAPRDEATPPRPTSEYGRTKRAAEEAVLAAAPANAVARVPLVVGRGYGPRATASESIAWALRAGRRLRLYTDQYRTPADPESVAAGLDRILEVRLPGVFHLAGPERISRHALGLRVAALLGLDPDLIAAETHDSYPPGAPRPQDACLDSTRTRHTLGWAPRPLDDAIRDSREAPDIIARLPEPGMRETLEDHLRRVTRSFTAPLAEEEALALGRGLLRELERAHAESPPRHPALDAASIAYAEGRPLLEGGSAEGSAAEDLFQLGALLFGLVSGQPAHVSWRLDGPPEAPGTSVLRRSLFTALASPRRERRFATAAEALAAVEAAARPPGAASWPLFRGDAGRRGVAGGAPAARHLLPLWTAAIGPVVASPVLCGGMVLAASADGRLVWLDAASGRVLHEMKLASAIESSPAVADAVAWVGTDDGECVAVDVASAAIRWRARIGQVVRSSPLPVGDRVFVGVVEAKGAGGLVALDASGKTAWKARLQAVFSSPALCGERVVVGSDDGRVHAVDAAKGALAWSASLAGKVRGTPAAEGELVYVGDFGGRVSALKAADGTPVWAAELGAALYSSPTLAEALIVLGSNDGTLHGLDRGTGAVRFQLRTRGPVVASPVAASGTFVVGSTDGDLYLIDAGGALLAREGLAAKGVASSPALEGDRVVVGSALGVHALRLAERP